MSEEKCVSTRVWVTALSVPKNEILAAALNAVRDELPPAAAVRTVLASSEKKVIDDEAGREYTVNVYYTPRGKRDDPIDLDQHLEGLETPVFNPLDIDGMA